MEPVCRGHFVVAALLADAVATTVVTAVTTAIGRAKQSTMLAAP